MTPRPSSPGNTPVSEVHEDAEVGSMLPFLVVMVLALLACAAFLVEFGGTLHAQQRANDLAAQAARTGGQQVTISPPGMTPGAQTLTVDPYAARAAAQAYLATAGVSGTVTVADAEITVTVADTYRSPIVGSIAGPMQVSGTATARLVRTVAGTEHPTQ